MGDIITLLILAALLIYAHKIGLVRDGSNNLFGGVCAGIADRCPSYLNVPLVRVLFVLFTMLTQGFGTLLYILLWITLPKE